MLSCQGNNRGPVITIKRFTMQKYDFKFARIPVKCAFSFTQLTLLKREKEKHQIKLGTLYDYYYY